MKVPAQPPHSFTTEARHLRTLGTDIILWRIYRTAGLHALPWDALRHYGPVRGQRWDPHEPFRGVGVDAGIAFGPEASVDPDSSVLYAATDPTTAFGEVYQARRIIARSEGGPALVAWQPARPLVFLDLTTNWPVLNGASAAIMMGDKRATQAWARAIHLRLGGRIDGLYAQSSITNEPVVTLFNRAETQPSFPRRPRFHALIADSTADPIVQHASDQLGYGVLA